MLSEPKNTLIRVTFPEKKFGNIYFDTTWWSKHDIVYIDTGMLSEPKNILILVTFQEKNFGNIYFDTTPPGGLPPIFVYGHWYVI